MTRRFTTFILSPPLWHIPSRNQFSQLASTATDGLGGRLAVLMESVVAIFGFERTGSGTMPRAHALGGMHNETGEREVCISDYMKYDDIESGGVVSSTKQMFEAQVLDTVDHAEPAVMRVVVRKLDCLCLPAPEIVGALGEGGCFTVKSPPISIRAEKHEGARCTTIPNSVVKVFTTTPSPTPVAASDLTAGAAQERTRKHAGMRTLMLPGRQLGMRKAPTESDLALRQIDEELAIEASQRDEYCARELASHGIFLHPPSVKASCSDDMTSRRTPCRIRRETSVGPTRPCWSARGDRGVPTVRIIKPEGTQTQKAIVKSGLNTDPHLSNSVATPSRQGRVRSNAVYVPSKAPIITRPAPARLGPETPLATPVHKAPRNLEMCRGKSRTSMCDWLDAISTGSNSLVADDVAMKGRPVLRASLLPSPGCTPPLSPTESTSSLDSSAPSTPVNELFVRSPLVEEKHTEVIYASRGHRRARCSYLGDGYENVVATAIPEELLTDEIGVAC
ncbi:hypothetical protein V565_232840 [Rhizoctonia solani 123E]|uniref:Uncharacterized protein n=1 Tax=Rhizoctonia solani 123E TaxID=1423351 RepID=A0A074RGK1_9AGAM|nr:hypothetical protein V565_232840 [Rhizoctonia solani 123E]